MLTIQITTEELRTLCEIVGSAQHKDSTRNRPDKALERLVERLKKIADDTLQIDARRELF